MLTRDVGGRRTRAVDAVVVDEWHELMGNKRGVQVQLALARLAQWRPGLVVWGAERPRWGNLTRRWSRCWSRAVRHQAVMVQGRVETRSSSTR